MMADKQSKIGDSEPRIPITLKKQLHVTLQFKSDVESAILKNHLQIVLKRTYVAVGVGVKYTSLAMFNTSVKDKLSPLATSMCVYKFPKWHLSSHICEHLPVWFIRGESRSPGSSILNLDLCYPVSAVVSRFLRSIQWTFAFGFCVSRKPSRFIRSNQIFVVKIDILFLFVYYGLSYYYYYYF